MKQRNVLKEMKFTKVKNFLQNQYLRNKTQNVCRLEYVWMSLMDFMSILHVVVLHKNIRPKTNGRNRRKHEKKECKNVRRK